MSYIKVELDYPIEDGTQITFKAPAANTAVEGLKVYYPSVTDSAVTTTSKTFTFVDSANAPFSIKNITAFAADSYVNVILNLTDSLAYVQNPTNNTVTQGLIDEVTTLATTYATTSEAGVVKVGSGLSVTSDGTLSSNIPTATKDTTGVIKVGEGLSVTGDGTVSTDVTKSYVDSKDHYKVGDIITTARTDLGDKWVLCNGNQISKDDYPDAHALFDEGSYALYIAPNSPPEVSTGASDYRFEVADDKILFNNTYPSSSRCDIYSRNGQFEQSVNTSKYLYYCNEYYLYYKYTGSSGSLRGNITWYYSKDPTGPYKSTSLYEAIEPSPNYQGMSGNLHNFFSDGTNCFLIGHYGSVYAPVDNIGSWKALNFGIGTVVYSTYIDGYYIFVGTQSSNFTNGLRICYTTTSPVSNPEPTEKVYNTSPDSKFDVVGIYHVNSVWHIFICYTQYSDKYLWEFYGSSLNNLTRRNITSSASRAQVLSINEQGFTFVQDGAVQYYDFNSQKVSTMGTLTLNGETFHPYYTFVDNDGVPFAFTSNRQELYYNHSAPLPDISVDRSYAYIKVKE